MSQIHNHNIFGQLRTELNRTFPERRNVIEGSLAAVLAQEHVLMLGPPGTAKSALVRTIASAFSGVYFERLLTKFSTPEELFGPISLRALEQDRFARVVTGKLPEAEFCFLDEVFKSNSAILNSLLTLMNERLFHNDGAPIRTPLVSMFGASNELPEGRELEALFDRFMVRFDMQYIQRPSNLRTMLLMPEPATTVRIGMSDLRAAQAGARAVTVTDDTVEALINIREGLRQEGFSISDRRLKKSLGLVRAVAFMADQPQTSPEDLLCLVDSLWREPKERTKVQQIVGKVADPVSIQAQEVLDAALELSQRIEQARQQDRKTFIGLAAQSLDMFAQQQSKLLELSKQAGRRASALLSDVSQEIDGLKTEYARAVSIGLGLKR